MDPPRRPTLPVIDPYQPPFKNSLPPPQAHAPLQSLAPPAGATRFPTTKAKTPCRFYSMKGGCQFGDKCEFGHFKHLQFGGDGDGDKVRGGPGPRHRGPGASTIYGKVNKR